MNSTIDMVEWVDGPHGFSLMGPQASTGAQLSVSYLGDFNGDSIADFAVGVPTADSVSNAFAAAGHSYVLYGSTSPHTSPIDLSTLSLAKGCVFYGMMANARCGFSLSGNPQGVSDVK